ncbi:MAG: hypothetical protein NT116_06110 [Candidatus Parcubacteria bacterium]|nr:hypothetical protein [Candidatus Parcubacteria bacterium]
MSTLQFDRYETCSIITRICIEKEAKSLSKQNGHIFILADLKDSRKITGEKKSLVLLQEKLLNANLPIGEII